MATQRSTRPADRSDSGPPGKGYRKALGLDESLMDQIWPETESAIRAEGLDRLTSVDRGGYGKILKAWRRHTGNPVAVKVLLDPQDAHRLKTFHRERKILEDAGVPVGIAPKFYSAREPENAQPFLILEWIDGKNLKEWLASNPTLTMDVRESICHLLFATYAKLHAANLVHRDVSTRNIMISGRRLLIIDFGSAARATPGYASVNTLSRVPVTPQFASGPVSRGERKAGPEDDVHAVAKVCFEVLTGEPIDNYATQLDREMKMKQTRCRVDLMRILLPKMADPPIQFVIVDEPLEF